MKEDGKELMLRLQVSEARVRLRREEPVVNVDPEVP